MGKKTLGGGVLRRQKQVELFAMPEMHSSCGLIP
jgi:hypothetical protein